MRRLSNFNTPGGLAPIAVLAMDDPGHGEPNRRYELTGFNTLYNGSSLLPGQNYPASFNVLPIFFHDDSKGPNAPANGVTEAALLSVVVDHLNGRQTGPEACHENRRAMDLIAEAIQLLNRRDTATIYGNRPMTTQLSYGF